MEELREEIRKVLNEAKSRLIESFGLEPDVLLPDIRYRVIEEIVSTSITREKVELTLTDVIDDAILNKYLGIPVFISLAWMTFQFTFSVAAPIVDAIDMFFSWIGEIIGEHVSNSFLASFLADGIVGGLGTILVFVPNIFFLFLALSALEDSGYLARVAFIFDRVMRKFRLSGRSIIPYLIGFGCNVPGVMATRTIAGENERILTALTNPLISCSARLPVYVLFAGVFFPDNSPTIILSLYILGIVLAFLISLVIGRFFLKGRPSPLIMELPEYSMPETRTLLMHMWERGIMFVRKAGTVILAGVIAIWALSNLPLGVKSVEESYLGTLGHIMEPLFKPFGWDWRIAVSIVFGFVAKEIVVGALGMIYGVEEEALEHVISQTMSPLSAYAFMTFVLIYVPCVATLAAIKGELGWKWAIFSAIYEVILAYLVALMIMVIGGVMLS